MGSPHSLYSLIVSLEPSVEGVWILCSVRSSIPTERQEKGSPLTARISMTASIRGWMLVDGARERHSGMFTYNAVDDARTALHEIRAVTSEIDMYWTLELRRHGGGCGGSWRPEVLWSLDEGTGCGAGLEKRKCCYKYMTRLESGRKLLQFLVAVYEYQFVSLNVISQSWFYGGFTHHEHMLMLSSKS